MFNTKSNIMKITLFISASLILISGMLQAQTKVDEKGVIGANELVEMQKAYKQDASNTMRQNAISNNDIKSLAVNRDRMGEVDTYFKYKVSTKGITDQVKSGRCWLFTGLNVLRPKVIEKLDLNDFSFSHNYLFFYDQLEKANFFLESIIATTDKDLLDREVEWLLKNPIGDGGQWTGVVNLIEKYGAVPSDVMPETKNSNNTSMVSRLIRRKLREDAMLLRSMAAHRKSASDLRVKKQEMMNDIYQMLAITLGEPVHEFDWRYKNTKGEISEMKSYTPQSFYKEHVNVNLRDYVMLMDDPTRAYNSLFEIQYDRHVYEGGNWKYINIPSAKIKTIAMASVKGNEAMYFSCDVGKQLDSKRGYLDIQNYDYATLMGVEFGMNKGHRVASFESGSSHGMTLVGVDVDKEEKPTKWLLENSWGKAGHNGHLIMTDEWFDQYMFRLVVHKKFISPEVLQILDKKPIYLPPWDPMFKMDDGGEN